jgi:WD40 repeat protein
VPHGLLRHPDGQHVIFPLGSSIVVRDEATNETVFLDRHAHPVCALALSPDGTLLVSGEAAPMGVKVRTWLASPSA